MEQIWKKNIIWNASDRESRDKRRRRYARQWACLCLCFEVGKLDFTKVKFGQKRREFTKLIHDYLKLFNCKVFIIFGKISAKIYKFRSNWIRNYSRIPLSQKCISWKPFRLLNRISSIFILVRWVSIKATNIIYNTDIYNAYSYMSFKRSISIPF